MRFLPLALCAALLACDDDGQSPEPVPLPELSVVETGAPALLSVWGASDEEVYFAGGTAEPEGGAVLHFDGTSISTTPTPPGPQLWWIWGHSGQLWACGEAGRILHRDAAGAWSEQDSGLDEKAVLWGVWGSSPTDLWAVGGSNRNGGPRGVVLRSSGDGTWTRVEDPALPPDLNLYKVWGTGPNDVFIVGEGGASLHFDGAGFTRHDVGVRDILFTVHGHENGPVLAVGGLSGALAFRWTGAGWVADAPENAAGLNGVFVRPDGSAVVTGNRGAVWIRSSDGRWARVDDVRAAVGPRTIHAAWVGTSIWAVGGDLQAMSDGVLLTDRAPRPTVDPQ